MTAVWESFVDLFQNSLTSIADFVSFAGGHRWALAIVLLTIGVRTLLLPVAVKQIKSMRETQRLQPEIQRLRQKYRNDRQRQMQEMQQLYQREGVNPYASCLPMIAQAPVFMAMYYAIRELSNVGPMPFLGLADLNDKASGTIGGWLLIALMTGAQLLTTRQLNPGQTDQQRRMQMVLPLFFVVLFINFPVALVLYWTVSNLFQLVQQMIMTRDMRKPGSGLRGMIAEPKVAAKTSGKREGKERNGAKPQVRPPAPKPQDRPSAQSEILASRRDIDDKRQRRRRNKKRKQRKR